MATWKPVWRQFDGIWKPVWKIVEDVPTPMWHDFDEDCACCGICNPPCESCLDCLSLVSGVLLTISGTASGDCVSTVGIASPCSNGSGEYIQRYHNVDGAYFLTPYAGGYRYTWAAGTCADPGTIYTEDCPDAADDVHTLGSIYGYDISVTCDGPYVRFAISPLTQCCYMDGTPNFGGCTGTGFLPGPMFILFEDACNSGMAASETNHIVFCSGDISGVVESDVTVTVRLV